VQILSLILPLAALVGYEQYTAARYGAGLLHGAVNYAARSHGRVAIPPLIRPLNTLSFVGGGALAVALLALASLRPRWLQAVLILSVAPLTLLASAAFQPPPDWMTTPWLFYVQYGLLTDAGLIIAVACLLALLRACRRPRAASNPMLWSDDLFLCLWIGGVFVFAASFNWSINARTILPLLPAIAILVTRWSDALRSQRAFLVALLCISGVVTLATTIADFRLAQACRDAAEQARAIPTPPGRPLFFAGHWGFQYYMQLHGARELDDEATDCRPGDVIVFPVNSYGIAPGGEHLKNLTIYQTGESRWLTTEQSRMGAAFYASYGQGLPFIVGPVPPEVFVVDQVTPQTRFYR
jgi:hypothetical protein